MGPVPAWLCPPTARECCRLASSSPYIPPRQQPSEAPSTPDLGLPFAGTGRWWISVFKRLSLSLLTALANEYSARVWNFHEGQHLPGQTKTAGHWLWSQQPEVCAISKTQPHCENVPWCFSLNWPAILEVEGSWPLPRQLAREGETKTLLTLPTEIFPRTPSGRCELLVMTLGSLREYNTRHGSKCFPWISSSDFPLKLCELLLSCPVFRLGNRCELGSCWLVLNKQCRFYFLCLKSSKDKIFFLVSVVLFFFSPINNSGPHLQDWWEG